VAERFKGKSEEELIAAITDLIVRNENLERRFY